MANRLTRIIYRMLKLKYRERYIDKGREFYEQEYRQQQIRMLTKKASGLVATRTARVGSGVGFWRACRDFCHGLLRY